ncbi:MAG: TonB-dependent vitamin B12 receptor, partial [Rhodanobacter sp.]
MKKTLLASLLLACATGAGATGQDPSGQDRAISLEPVIVTATRTPIDIGDSLSSVSVISRADIERLQPVSIADLL